MRKVWVGMLMVIFGVTILTFAQSKDVENKPMTPQPATSPAPAVEPDHTVRLTVDVIEATIDINGLTMDFQKIDPGKHQVDRILEALNKIGQASVTYRFDNRVMMQKQITLSSGQNQPFVAGQNLSKNGNVTSAIEYEKAGTYCRFMLKELSEGKYILEGETEWSGIGESGIKIAENVNAPIPMKMKMDIFSKLRLDVPVLLSSSVNLPEKENKTMVKTVIYRIMISPVE